MKQDVKSTATTTKKILNERASRSIGEIAPPPKSVEIPVSTIQAHADSYDEALQVIASLHDEALQVIASLEDSVQRYEKTISDYLKPSRVQSSATRLEMQLPAKPVVPFPLLPSILPATELPFKDRKSTRLNSSH